MTDIFRQTHRPLSEDEAAAVADVKDIAGELLTVLNTNMSSAWVSSERQRYYALAVTNLEQAVMWAVKGMTL